MYHARALVETYLRQCCYHVPGQRVRYSDWYEQFAEWCRPHAPGRNNVAWRCIPAPFVYGKGHSNVRYVGNCSLEPDAPGGEPYIVVNGFLRRTPGPIRKPSVLLRLAHLAEQGRSPGHIAYRLTREGYGAWTANNVRQLVD